MAPFPNFVLGHPECGVRFCWSFCLPVRATLSVGVPVPLLFGLRSRALLVPQLCVGFPVRGLIVGLVGPVSFVCFFPQSSFCLPPVGSSPFCGLSAFLFSLFLLGWPVCCSSLFFVVRFGGVWLWLSILHLVFSSSTINCWLA